MSRRWIGGRESVWVLLPVDGSVMVAADGCPSANLEESGAVVGDDSTKAGDLNRDSSSDQSKAALHDEVLAEGTGVENADETDAPSPEAVDSEIHPEDLVTDADDFDDDEFVGEVEPIEEAKVAGADDEEEKQWFILKVQSNREKSICDALRRRVAVNGMDDLFGDILVPTEDVAEFKNGKRRVVKRKLFPGYIVAHMVLNDETWFLVRETTGIGDFTGAAGKPSPMLPNEVERIVKAVNPESEDSEQIKTAIPFKAGDRVRIKDGTFENFEGDVESIDEANGRVTVTIKIFGRSTPVELEHWQIENV